MWCKRTCGWSYLYKLYASKPIRVFQPFGCHFIYREIIEFVVFNMTLYLHTLYLLVLFNCVIRKHYPLQNILIMSVVKFVFNCTVQLFPKTSKIYHHVLDSLFFLFCDRWFKQLSNLVIYGSIISFNHVYKLYIKIINRQYCSQKDFLHYHNVRGFN